MKKRLLVQTQLSNISYAHKKFDLACDSGWQMVMGRVREMLRLNPELEIDVMGPALGQLVAKPKEVNPDLEWNYHYGYVDPQAEDRGRLNYIQHEVLQNALATRYDFHFDLLSRIIGLHNHKQYPQYAYDAVYINDPMLLRNFQAMFYLMGGYQPRFYVHSHFVDVPEVPKFPKECSLGLGQVEAALTADYNFWQCESAMLQFFDSMGKWYTQDVVDDVRAKSEAWDDGYSQEETNTRINMEKVRFSVPDWEEKTQGKLVVFFPNRVSPSSGDYTNGMKFAFELLPALRQVRQDFVVVFGNPNQKFSNAELQERCGKHGMVTLTPDALNRDEYKFVAKNSSIVVGLYDKDAYGGTAARECIELGCMPLWLDNHEYSSIAREARYPFLCKPDFSDFTTVFNNLVDSLDPLLSPWLMNEALKKVVRQRCSYEETTPTAMRRMGLL